MAQKDKTEKLLEDYNDVFADIFNVLVFERAALDEHHLQDSSTEGIYKAAEGNFRSQFRDIDKCYTGIDNKQIPLVIAEFGIENQSHFEKYMAYRIMGYDYASYRKQIDNKAKVITPVLSIILNFSNEIYPHVIGLK